MLRPLVGLALLLTVACKKPTPWIYVSHGGSPSVSVFSAKERVPTGIPQLVMRRGITIPAGLGSFDALHVLGNRLYGTAGNGTLQQFFIEASNGDLVPTANLPIGASPHAITSRGNTLYVLSQTSADVRTFDIDAAGAMTSGQVTTLDAPRALAVDVAGARLFVGSAGGTNTPARACAHAIGTDGRFSAAPVSCVDVAGPVVWMAYRDDVLFVLSSGPGVTSTTHWLAAYSAAAGNALTLRGQPLDVGGAGVGNFGISADGQRIFLSRHGGFQTISTSDPLQDVASVTPVTNSQSCRWPPAGAGYVLVDPRGRVIYLSDPIGFPGTTSNTQGPRISVLLIESNGALTPQLCEAPGGNPNSIAFFMP